jgi:hypothetical protein
MPPVELGKIEEDVEAAEEQISAGDEVDPVTDADVVRVDVDPPPGAGIWLCSSHVVLTRERS